MKAKELLILLEKSLEELVKDIANSFYGSVTIEESKTGNQYFIRVIADDNISASKKEAYAQAKSFISKVVSDFKSKRKATVKENGIDISPIGTYFSVDILFTVSFN